MEVSALKYSGGLALHGRSPLLRLQSDERLVAVVRRGNQTAFEVLVGRYSSRLLAFCRHLLGSREDAEDVLQEVMAAAFNAMLADDRPINVRPWLYRIARNRCLNHLRRIQAVGVDSMDIHLSDNGASTADKVHDREDFRLLVGDINQLPETQRTALVLREMDALSYEQIAEAMETTVPSVKSLLVRARISLAEAAEARVMSCDEVRIELGEVAEGLLRRPTPLVRRHLRSCARCETFRGQLKDTNKALAALLPFGPFVLFKKLALTHLGHSAGSGAAAGSSAAGSGAAAGGSLMAGSGAGGFVSAGVGAIATKAAAGLAAAALVTAGAVEVDQRANARHAVSTHAAAPVNLIAPATSPPAVLHASAHAVPKAQPVATKAVVKPAKPVATTTSTPAAATTTTATAATPVPVAAKAKSDVTPGRTQTQTDPTVLSGSTTAANTDTGATNTGNYGSTTTAPDTTTPATTTTLPSTGGAPDTGSGTTTAPTDS